MKTTREFILKQFGRRKLTFRDLMLLAILILLTGVMLAIGAMGQSAIDPQGHVFLR
ncbi:hypothetical protein [Geothrix sp. 21YS21S-2]|uniref:hypothetical protein n=1 Tax=Geothrix sp. 21YS21S-2 TaxID=3068893 RepID=UPI0027B9164F|nr:hypothetical protein [Geothrix sp. 21YS21S-2]